jgi:predicted NBD/HSP70 family sugar kinase
MGGHLLTGQRGNAGAIGSMPLDLARGGVPQQLLEVASGWQLERALEAAGLDPLLVHQDAILDTTHAPLVLAWLTQAADALAMVATSSVALLDLDAVVLDGSLAPGLLAALKAQTEQALARYQQAGIQAPVLHQGKVGAHARALGGALLPLHTQFFPDKDIFLKQDLA